MLLAVFVGTIAVSKYMSVGSIVLMIGIFITFIVQAVMGLTCFDFSNGYSESVFYEGAVIVFFLAALAIFKHKANIIRLKNHEENKFRFKKQEGI